jgi:hypothetical protein
MFRILDNLFHRKNNKSPSSNFVDSEPVETKKCQRCLRRYDSYYLNCPYCNCSELYKSMSVYFYVLRR